MKSGSSTPEGVSVRLTPCRRAVLEALEHTQAHPTVRELRDIAARRHPSISLATVYNSLSYLQKIGLVNEHRLCSGSARYCVNYTPHMHLVDDLTGRMIDVQLKPGLHPEDVFDLPQGVTITSINAYLHGTVPSPSL